MDSPLREYVERLAGAGLRIAGAARCRRAADAEGPWHAIEAATRRHEFEGLEPLVESVDAAGGLASDHASLDVALAMLGLRDRIIGRRVLELGCGTGLLAILAARLGAEVVASDVDAEAVALARRNAVENRVHLELRLGDLLEPVRDEGPFDWALANLPHKPVRAGNGVPRSQAGGTDGADLWLAALPELARLQRPGAHLIFFMHSLPSPSLLAAIAERYELELLSWKLRWMAEGEYGAHREAFRDRHRRGLSFLHRDEAGREGLVACTWLGRRKTDPS